MGIGRTGDGTLGIVTVKLWPLAVAVLLAGCNATVQVAAVVSGGAAGGITANPAIGFAVGVAVDAGATYAVRYYGRTRQGAEQDAIAEVAGDLPIGTEAAWKIEHTIPIDTQLATCKEIAFSVDEGKGAKLQRSWFTADVCKQAQRWKWASAEPAVERWEFLQ
jgi:hypothetical protein